MPYDASSQADHRVLLPPPTDVGATRRAGLVARESMDYRPKYRGALLGGAIGDALGRPWEGRGPCASREDLSSLSRYTKWGGWTTGPVGTITDDTQMTMCVAESICATGRLDPADLAQRFVEWLPIGRGKGRATVEAVSALATGTPWYLAGAPSAGNAAAMRVAPIGLRHPLDVNALRRDAALSAMVTHATQMAVISAVAQAFSVAFCLLRSPTEVTTDSLRSELLAGLAIVLDGVMEEAVPERRDDRPGLFRLRDRLTEAVQMSTAVPAEAFEYFHNGAFVLESLPTSLWCFLRHWDDPEQAILTAVSGGYDADTVAAMTGALAGALHGEGSLPTAWLDGLEYAQELRSLADSLLDLARPSLSSSRTTGRDWPPLALAPTAAQPALPAPSLPDQVSRVLGCLLGGAIGDALGAPIEFAKLPGIRNAHGPAGVTGYVPGHWGPGAFTDDTQMTLFTAEGLIRADNRMRDRGLCDVPLVIWGAYQRWLDTQDHPGPSNANESSTRSGWLVNEPALRSQRAPGTTCLSALHSGTPGSSEAPLNNSKGCGGVMRVAPVGLVSADPFDLGSAAAALTHGHPSGYLAAGVFAVVVAGLTRGDALTLAIDQALQSLRQHPGHEETLNAVHEALALAASGREPSPEAVETLGGGWIAEEALAIALYCAMVAPDFRQGVLLAVNHSGDSDSTGSMVGNLIGATLGVGDLPKEWLQDLEARSVIQQVAADLAGQFVDGPSLAGPDMDRYPPW